MMDITATTTSEEIVSVGDKYSQQQQQQFGLRERGTISNQHETKNRSRSRSRSKSSSSSKHDHFLTDKSEVKVTQTKHHQERKSGSALDLIFSIGGIYALKITKSF